MTKQEMVFNILESVRLGQVSSEEAMIQLSEIGVVIKVDRDIPILKWEDVKDTMVDKGTCDKFLALLEKQLEIMRDAGYVATIPLKEG